MEISFLPAEYVINTTREVPGGSIESDFMVRAVRIKNPLSEPVTINKIKFDLRIEGKSLKHITYPEEEIAGLCKGFPKAIAGIKGEVGQVFLGTLRFWDAGHVSDSPELHPGQETGLLLEHFRIAKSKPVDECVIGVTYTHEGSEKEASVTIPVKEYRNANKFIFPLKGSWLAVNTHDDVHFHRRMHSQEFAMDIVQYTKDFRLFEGDNPDNHAFPGYGAEILAIAEGKVADCHDSVPENPPGLGSRLPEEEWNRIRSEHGFVPFAAGNYVTIEHQGGEYSFYAHLIPGSLKVKKGDRVEQGHIIGELGNTGNSDCPHLHFHLMAGPSILSARGLPCRFTNLKSFEGSDLSFIEQNYSVVHAG